MQNGVSFALRQYKSITCWNGSIRVREISAGFVLVSGLTLYSHVVWYPAKLHRSVHSSCRCKNTVSTRTHSYIYIHARARAQSGRESCSFRKFSWIMFCIMAVDYSAGRTWEHWNTAQQHSPPPVRLLPRSGWMKSWGVALWNMQVMVLGPWERFVFLLWVKA